MQCSEANIHALKLFFKCLKRKFFLLIFFLISGCCCSWILPGKKYFPRMFWEMSRKIPGKSFLFCFFVVVLYVFFHRLNLIKTAKQQQQKTKNNNKVVQTRLFFVPFSWAHFWGLWVREWETWLGPFGPINSALCLNVAVMFWSIRSC